MKYTDMKFRTFTLCLLLLGFIAPVSGQTGMDDPLTQAMMKAYQDLLDEDPRDYETLFRRASEYYKHNDYPKALTDINEAIRVMPEDDPDIRYQAHQLRANIYMQTGRYDNAVNDLNAVLSINPTDYITIYQRGTAYYDLGRYEDAKNDFNALRKMNARSQEALFGLARIAVKENNIGMANDLCDEAVTLTPGVSDVYIRRASVRSMMGNIPGAVEDYIIAISTDQANTPRALSELALLSRTDYPVVISGLSKAIGQAPKIGMFYYIRAMIAQSHCHYSAAIADYDRILTDHLDTYPGINASLCECYYALGQYDTALLNADYAVGATHDNKAYYVLKSDVERALGNYDTALACAESSLEKDPNYNPALVAKALAQISLKEYAEASVALSEAAMNEAENPYIFMLRAWVLGEYRNQKANAESCYERILDMDFKSDDVTSLRGFALLYLGREIEGDDWMETILESVDDYDGMVNYYGACYWGARGDLNRAFACMETSLEKGYANYHNWTRADDARVNVAPLRDDPRFKQLLEKYARIFK